MGLKWLKIKFSNMIFLKNLLKKGLLLIVLVSCKGFAQDEPFFALNRLSSPEAAANNVSTSSVDMFRGRVNTAIPLHKFKGREIDLPIILSYSSTGIKVDQVASNVGLGWNLEVGGRINRIVTKIADDKISANTDALCEIKEEYWLDSTKDYYKATAPNFEDIFKYRQNIKYKSLKNPKIKIQRSDDNNLNQWKVDGEYIITDQDGNKYYYGERNANEKVYSRYLFFSDPGTLCPNVDVESTTSIMLTKIVSKNNMDTYDFYYEPYEWAEPILYPGEGYMLDLVNFGQRYFRNNITDYRIRHQMLKTVYHNGDKILDFVYSNRDDLLFTGSANAGNALSEIKLYNYKATSVYKKIKFDYTYFGTANSNTHFTSRRLKLDTVSLCGTEGGNDVVGDTHHFDYIDPSHVPSILSSARDYLGLYNGKDSNFNLIYNPTTDNGDPNKKRKYNFDKSLIGTLEKITYPTKGYAKFEFEQNALQGGFGHDTIPATTGIVFDKEQLAYLSAGQSEFVVCPSANPLSAAHPQMQQVTLAQYPDNNSYYSQNQSFFLGVKTAFIRIDENTGKDVMIRTMGDGVYSIQKVYNCDPENDYILYCEMSQGTPEYYPHPQNATVGCMKETVDVFNKPTGVSQPLDFTKGGLTVEGYTPATYSFQDYGTYQITLWAYSNADTAESVPPSVDIYKLNPRTIITHPSYTVNRDQTNCPIDGFRIKSVANYTSENVLADKKVYKYSNGYIVDKVDNINIPNEDLATEAIIYNTKGYANTEIIHYQKVYEISVDGSNNDNGYIEYQYKKNTATDYDCDSPIYYSYVAGSVKPFSYSNIAGSPSEISYVENDEDFLYEKNVYDSAENLLQKKTYEYDRLSFDNGCVVCGFNIEPAIYHFNFLKKVNVKNYFNPNKITETNTTFDYVDFQLAAKTLLDVNGNPYDSESYTPNDEAINNPAMQSQITLIETMKRGTTKLVFDNFNGKYLIREVQSSTPDQPLETKLLYEYDSEGNRVTAIQYTPGTITPASIETMVWGYSDRFPVARIKGIRYSDIIASDAILISDIKALSHNEVSPINEALLRGKLQELREAYPNNMVTTYTYNPVIGMTSMTDPTGQTLFYEYDIFGRPTFTKKLDLQTGTQSIVSEKNYNTRN